MSFTLRPMQHADLAQVAAIAAACPEAPQWPQSIYASYLPSQVEPPISRTAVVAVEDDAVLAFVCATLLLDGTQNLCQLDSMAVYLSARRRGIGAALLRAILAWAAQNGARHFSLEVRASNAPAIALYHHFGLRQEGRRPRYYAHPEEDALILGMPITAGSPHDVFHVKNG